MADLDKNRFKFLCRSFLDLGADEEALGLFLPVLLNEPETKSQKAGAPPRKTKIQRRTAAIAKETAQVAISGKVLPVYYDSVSGQYKSVPQISEAIMGPPKEYAWTTGLPGYKAAWDSVVSALHRLWAATQAAAAGHNSKTSRLDVFLHQIRAGIIKSGDPRIQEAIRIADKYGFFGNIRERIAEEFHNAEKRVPKDYSDQKTGNALFYDLNRFRAIIASCWVCALFWLMPDRLIADFLLRKKKGLPPGIKCNRQTISEAVKQMGLHKHKSPIVKSIGADFKLLFVEGYPPKS
ncbi:MAG TPA: hypothetical protein VFU09_07615 [Candidatus Udaeobacter sp.]|nr:hypothetical protein [Candidatus Udaeobacter sp.]